eukprot:Em0001g3019a
MAETAKLIELLQQQLEAQRKQMEVLIVAFTSGAVKQESSSVPTLAATAATIPSFVPFDATAELWMDYWARFQTFLGANSVPVEKRAQVFLTNQSRVTYKLLSNLASQQNPPESVNELSLEQIEGFMKNQFDPCSTLRESGSNSGVICVDSRSIFKIKDNELTFARAIAVAVETEEAALRWQKKRFTGLNPVLFTRSRLPKGRNSRVRKAAPLRISPRVPAHGDNFCAEETWKKLWKPRLSPTTSCYEVANGHPLPALGVFSIPVVLQDSTSSSMSLTFTVTKVPRLNLLGRDAIIKLGINVSALMGLPVNIKQNICRIGLKDFELDVKFKADAKPVFCKPQVVPFAIQEDLCIAYDAGIARGVWQSVQFNNYGTHVVSIRRVILSGQTTAKLRVCGDYSVTVNPQLEPHCHPIPRPEDLMQKLGGGYGFTKIDLSDAYNQIMHTPESQRRLALSTHRGVLLQMRLSFGISSAPGYFQEIMDMLISDLKGVAVYMDDILVSGTTAAEHLQNLKSLLKRLEEKGLRCRLEKSGNIKGHKVDADKMMPPPENVSSLRSFLGSVQFYSKFLPNLASVTEPLHRLTKKEVSWTWGTEQVKVFKKLKDLLCADTVLAHFDPSLPIGISCDASEVGVGAVLFHWYSDGGERPIANASKTLSQIQKEALAIVFALRKFHQFLYGRPFILITDHKPLLALFGPTKATPALAANRLACRALMLGQYHYTIEYWKSAEHGNADALSHLPVGPDVTFDAEEGEADVNMVCTIKTISLQLNPMDQGVLAKESSKDPVKARVMRYTREGWPPQLRSEGDSSVDCLVEIFRKLSVSLSTIHGCLLLGSRVVIPPSLRAQVLQLLRDILGHYGMQRMKQLACTAVQVNKNIL